MAIGLAVAVLSSDWATKRTQRELVRIIESRLDADAEVQEVTMSIFPRLSIDGRGFTLTRTGADHRLPFIRVDKFHASGWLLDVLRRSIQVVEVEGFQIDVARGNKPEEPAMRKARDLEIGEIRVSGGLLRILPDDPEKLPLNFDLQSVNFYDFSFDHAGRYMATVVNPKPEGLVRSSGW